MRFKDKLRVIDHPSVHRDQFIPAPAYSIEESSLPPHAQPFDLVNVQEHTLRLELRVDFQCRRQDYEAAKRNAEERLVRALYEDIERLCLDAIACVQAGDRYAALDKLHRIMDECK